MQVKEIGSGASQRERREKLLEAVRRREIDVVLVWRLDRWGRSVTDLLATLQELKASGRRLRLADRGGGSDVRVQLSCQSEFSESEVKGQGPPMRQASGRR